MEIPHSLKESVREGKAVLFLGSGASIGATLPGGKGFPTGEQLGKLLSEKFLGGSDADNPLSVIAEYAVSETDLITVQAFLRELFADGAPADFHNLIPTFKWAGLVTTNFDLIVEEAYRRAISPLQELVPFLSDRDRVDHKLRSGNSVPYIKLHGCITRCEDPELPLILTIDQYVTHRKRRDILFRRFAEWGAQYPVIFVGQQLQDLDLRQVLLELADEGMERPRFFTVTPNPSERQIRFWETKRVTALPGTLEEFLRDLDRDTDPSLRAVRLPERDHPIERKFIDNESQLSEHALDMLSQDVTYLRSDLASSQSDPRDFYKGYSYGWNAIQSSYDAKRNIEDTILSDTILIDDVDRPSVCDFYLIKGHAGSGKTVIMKRIAWDAMSGFDKICLYCDSSRGLDSDAIFEIVEKVGERVFLFIDKAAEHLYDIRSLLQRARHSGHRLTIFGEARTNEWNVDSGALDSLLNDVYEVRYLARNEIPVLIEKLEANNSLGLLEGLSLEERYAAFDLKAGRQILVALHEATMGKPFEEIVFDEYKQISPENARLLYLTVCSLNRLGVPVRAGLINRVHGISFDEFQNRFFGPLESVVFTQVYFGHDMAYSTRHPWIAQIVFEKSLRRPEDRLDLYIRLLDALDIGYESDRKAFRNLIRAKNLIELFADPKMVRAIYDAANGAGSGDPYYYQQRAIYEMKRENPALGEAYELLRKAAVIAPNDRSIMHSMAELELQRAEQASDPRESNRHLVAASELAAKLTGGNAESSFGYHTICKIALQKVEDAIQESFDDDQILTEAVKNAEDKIQKALQRFPDDEYLLDAEAKLSQAIGASEKAIAALKRAFARNPMSPYIAIRLARLHEENQEFPEARKVLEGCLEGLPNDRPVHAALAQLLTRHFPNEGDSAEYHWRRSFTDGDTNYDSQFWYARQLWLSNKRKESKQYFDQLRTARVSPSSRQKVRGVIRGEDSRPVVYRGRVERLEANYAFLSSQLSDEWAFLHRSNVETADWERLESLVPVTYQVGFNYRGLAALNIEL